MTPTRARDPFRLIIQGAVIGALLGVMLGGCSTPAAAFDVGGLTVAEGGGEVLPGDEVRVTAVVENTGTAAGTYAAAITVDGVPQDSQDVALDAGQSTTVEFTIPAASPGDHEVALGAMTARFHVTSGPHFVVNSLRLAAGPTEILAGDALEYVAELENVGTEAGTYEAAFSVDSIIQSQQSVALSPGQSTSVRFTATAGPAGSYSVGVGDATVPLAVLEPAALAVTALALSPAGVATKGKLAAAVTVANTGEATGTITVKVTIDKKKAATKDVTVAGGQSTTLQIPLKVPAAGRHTVAAGDVSAKLVVWKITRPANGKVIVNKIKGGRGELTIENGNDLDAVVVLARKSSPKKAVLVVYVRAGKDATVKRIKDGTYIVYYSLGKRWDSKSRVFTTDLERSRFQDTIRFKTTRSAYMITWKTWTLTLNAVIGGNAPTEGVDPGDFPGVP